LVDEVERVLRYGLTCSYVHLKIPAVLQSVFVSFMVMKYLIDQLLLRTVKYRLVRLHLEVYLMAVSARLACELIHV
jgi:hypothetical protein